MSYDRFHRVEAEVFSVSSLGDFILQSPIFQSELPLVLAVLDPGPRYGADAPDYHYAECDD